MFKYAVFECLFAGLLAQILMVLIAGLGGALLTQYSLCLGSIVAGPTCQSNVDIKFRFSLSSFVLFLVDYVVFFC